MKKKFFKTLGIIISLLLLGIIFNIYVDSYCVFGNNYKYQVIEPNQNYLKTKYILENKTKFNALMFGSSRIGNIPTEIIKELKIYNMTYSEGIPEEWEETIKILLNNEIKLKVIFLGLDDISFKVSKQKHKNQQLRKTYIELKEISSRLKNYALINPLTENNFIKLKAILLNEETEYSKNFQENLNNTGRLFQEEGIKRENKIKLNPLEHLSDPRFKKFNDYAGLNNTEVDNVMDILKRIEKLCDNQDIELILFFNPVHELAYKNLEKKEEYNHIRKLIKNEFKKLKIFDFTDIEISSNNLYWFETSHFTSIIGKRMLKEIFPKENIDIK